MQCRIIMLLIFIEFFSVSVLRISPFWLCLHLYFCCIHSRKFTLCLFTLFFSETFSIMGPIQHGEQLSYWNSKSNPTFCFIHKQQQAAEFSLKRGPGNLKPLWHTGRGRQWLVITGHWQPGSCVTRCHHHQQQAALGVVTGEAGEGRWEGTGGITWLRWRRWRRWWEWWLTPGWSQAWRCSAQMSPAANTAESQAAPQWSLLSLMSLRSPATPHSQALMSDSQYLRLSYTQALDWVRSLLSPCVSSVLSLSLTAHSSHSSAWPRLEAPGAWSRSVHSCSRQSPASSPCPALPRPAATAKGSVRPNWVWSVTTRAGEPAPCQRILKFSTHGNDSSHTRDSVIRWGPVEDRRHKVTDQAAAPPGVWQVYD